MSVVRVVVLTLALIVLISIQDAGLRYWAISGVVPNLALLVVVAAAVVRGSDYGAGVGLLAGLLLDLIPPASGTIGRWALCLVVVGYLAGKVSVDARRSWRARLLLMAGCSFVATSLYALLSVMLNDTTMQASRMPEVVVIGTIEDVVAAAILMPLAIAGMARLRPAGEFA